MRMKLIKHHWELDVYKLAMEMAREVFQLSKLFPREETYSLTDQIRRSSRSVSAQLAEAWRRRKYEAVFVNKLNETREIHRLCGRVLGKLVTMGNKPDTWILQKSRASIPITH